MRPGDAADGAATGGARLASADADTMKTKSNPAACVPAGCGRRRLQVKYDEAALERQFGSG